MTGIFELKRGTVCGKGSSAEKKEEKAAALKATPKHSKYVFAQWTAKKLKTNIKRKEYLVSNLFLTELTRS